MNQPPRDDPRDDRAQAAPIDDEESAATLAFPDANGAGEAAALDGLSPDALETLNHARPGDTIAMGRKRKSDERPWDDVVHGLPARMSVVMPPEPEGAPEPPPDEAAPPVAPEWERALQFIQEISSGDMIAAAGSGADGEGESAAEQSVAPQQEFGGLLVTDLLSIVDPEAPLPPPRPAQRRDSGEKEYDSNARIDDMAAPNRLSTDDSGQFAAPTLPGDEDDPDAVATMPPRSGPDPAYAPTEEYVAPNLPGDSAFDLDEPYDEVDTAGGLDAGDAFISEAFAAPPSNDAPTHRPATREVSIVREADMPPLASGGPIADFVLSKKIGQGGQGEVWKAWQTSLSREVAVKRLRAGDVGDFLIEAYTSGALDHPNIVPVHDLGRIVDEGRESPLIAMKLVRGVPWDILLKMDRQEGTMSLDELLAKHLRVLIDVCNAVAFAHSKGIIHRDLKPSQVMLGDYGEVFLMDWGLAMSVHNEVPLAAIDGSPKHRTRETAANRCGSPAYMAPEQTHESTERLGLHTDVYLLGAILQEIVAGQPPHYAESAQLAYHMAGRNQKAPLPARCPPDLRKLVESCLDADPAKRPPSAKAFRVALEDYLGGAGKKRESEEIVEEVVDEFEGVGADALEYERLAVMEQRLERALQLWPENASAEEMRVRVVRLHGRRALRAGDLQLARTLAVGLPAEDDERAAILRGVMTAEVDQDKIRLAARHRAWSVIGASAFVTIASLFVSFYALRGAELRDESDRARRIHENQIQLAEQRLDIQRRAAKLMGDEARLADRLYRAAGPPAELTPSSALDAERRSEREALLGDVEAVAADRQRLAASTEIAKPSARLALGEAWLRLELGVGDAGEARRAKAAAESALATSPGDPEATLALGAASYRLGERQTAWRHLRHAAELAAAELGEGAPLAALARALAEEAATAGSPEPSPAP